MNDIERKKYATHIEKLSDIDLIREISQYPKTWSDERKIIEEEQERRRALLQQSPEYLILYHKSFFVIVSIIVFSL